MVSLLHRATIKKPKPGLVASYDIRPGNGEGLFWFWHFINLSLTYSLRHLPTYLQPRDPHGANSFSSFLITNSETDKQTAVKT